MATVQFSTGKYVSDGAVYKNYWIEAVTKMINSKKKIVSIMIDDDLIIRPKKRKYINAHDLNVNIDSWCNFVDRKIAEEDAEDEEAEKEDEDPC